TRREVLRWSDPIDLTHAIDATLGFTSLLTARNSTAEIQVSVDGVNWDTLDGVPLTTWFTPVGFDLSVYLGRQIFSQFVFDAVAPNPGAPADSWRFHDAIVNVRMGKGGG